MTNMNKPSKITAAIVNYGLYETVVLERQPQPDLPYAAYEEMSTVRHLQTTDTIKGAVGVAFGLSYSLQGTGPGAVNGGEARITVKTVVTYPAPGIQDEETGQLHTQSITYREVPLDAEVYEGYYIGSGQDIVEGEWRYQLWHQEQKLAQKVFHLIKEK